MAVSININTFPAEGGSFIIQITKDDNRVWNITPPSETWISNVIGFNQSNHLYELYLDIAQNSNVADRTTTLIAGNDLSTESFTLTQYGTGTTLSAEVVATSPSGDIVASGGIYTVDIYANGGTDALSSASSADAFATLTSTTHNVSSGGYTVTRFVFTFSANTSPTARSAALTFTVSDGGGNTATTSISKAQKGVLVNQGTLSASDVNIAANATSATSTLSQTDMAMGTVTGVPGAAWITDASVQVQGGQYVCVCTTTANTGATARSATVVLSGDDIYGNTITATFTITQAGTGTTHTISPAWRTGLGYDGILTWEGGQEQALITFTGNWSGDTSISYGTLPDGVTIALPNNTVLNAYYTGGNIDNTTVIPITISRTGDDNVVYTATLMLTLRAGGVFPIWEDTYGEIVSDEDFEDYTLEDNGQIFYAGRAFKYPDENSIRVNVSRVVAPYLTTYFKDVEMYSDGTLVAAMTFVRDYSYDPGIDYSQNQPLSFPINGLIPSGVKMTVSEWASTSGGSFQVTDDEGSLVVNEVLQKGLNTAEFITGAEGKTYTFGIEVFKVVSACEGALLKYVNAYGGWDYFFVEGVCKKTDKITRSSYEKDADALSSQFETKDYQASMEATWQGHTGWLTDEQSFRMKHLVESVEVYMLDLATGDEMPVVMRDSSLEYKKFINGRKLVNYTLQWTESQKKIRR